MGDSPLVACRREFITTQPEFSSREPVTFFKYFFVFSRSIQHRFLQAPKQNRHPERSLRRVYRKQRALWRGVEGPRRCLLADALGGFQQQTTTEDKNVVPETSMHLSRRNLDLLPPGALWLRGR